MGKNYYDNRELREGEVFIFNSTKEQLPNRNGKLKTMRFGKTAYSITGEKLTCGTMLPVFIHKTELDLLDELWNKELSEIRKRR